MGICTRSFVITFHPFFSLSLFVVGFFKDEISYGTLVVSGRIGGTHYYFCIQVWLGGWGVLVKMEERVGSDGAMVLGVENFIMYIL